MDISSPIAVFLSHSCSHPHAISSAACSQCKSTIILPPGRLTRRASASPRSTDAINFCERSKTLGKLLNTFVTLPLNRIKTLWDCAFADCLHSAALFAFHLRCCVADILFENVFSFNFLARRQRACQAFANNMKICSFSLVLEAPPMLTIKVYSGWIGLATNAVAHNICNISLKSV